MYWNLEDFGYLHLLFSCVLFVIVLIAFVSSRSLLGEFVVNTAIDRSDDELKNAIAKDNDNISKIKYYMTPWSFCMTTTRRSFIHASENSVELQDFESVSRTCTSHSQMQEIMTNRRSSCSSFQKDQTFDMTDFYADDSSMRNNFVLEKIFSITALILLFFFCFLGLASTNILGNFFTIFVPEDEATRHWAMLLTLWLSIALLIATIVLILSGKRKVPERTDNGNASWNAPFSVFLQGLSSEDAVSVRATDIVLGFPVSTDKTQTGAFDYNLEMFTLLRNKPTLETYTHEYGRRADYYFQTFSTGSADFSTFHYYPTSKAEKTNPGTNYGNGLNVLFLHPVGAGGYVRNLELSRQDENGDAKDQSRLASTFGLKSTFNSNALCNFNEDFLLYFKIAGVQDATLNVPEEICDIIDGTSNCNISSSFERGGLLTNLWSTYNIRKVLFGSGTNYENLTANNFDDLFTKDPICDVDMSQSTEITYSQTYKCLKEHSNFVQGKAGFGWYFLTVMIFILFGLSVVQTILSFKR